MSELTFTERLQRMKDAKQWIEIKWQQNVFADDAPHLETIFGVLSHAIITGELIIKANEEQADN